MHGAAQNVEQTAAPRRTSLPFLSAVHPDHKERVSHIFWDGVRSGGGWTFEAPFRYADGSYRWHFDRAVPVRDAKGKVLRFVGSSSDIQELRSERDSLVDRERRLLAIIDGSPNPIFLKDPDGRFCWSTVNLKGSPVSRAIKLLVKPRMTCLNYAKRAHFERTIEKCLGRAK